VAELLRPELHERVVAELALYMLMRLVQRGEHVVDDEKLVKLLFFAIYTEPGPDGKPVLRDNPPRLSPETEFRIYLHGPYMRVRRLVESMNKLGSLLLGMRASTVVSLERRLTPSLPVREALGDLADMLRELLQRRLESVYGHGYMDMVDSWIVERLGRMSTAELEKLSLRVLHLEDEGPPVKKAMVFNMSLDDYIEFLRELDRIRRGYEAGTLQPDYDLGSLDELEED